MQLLIKSWNTFWFESFDQKRFRLFQVVFLSTILVLYGFRLLDFEFLYTDKGLLPFSILSDIPELLYKGLPLEHLAKNATLGFVLHIILIALIALTLFYRQIWPLAVLIYVLHVVFLRRNPMSVYGVDMVATFWFLYMAMVNPTAKSQVWQSINSVAYRLIQLQLCIIYAYSGFDKARGLTWWKGDAVWYALGNTQVSSIDFSFLAHTPAILTIMAFVTVLWETYFPVLIWVPQIKKYVLTIGIALHLGIAFMMNLYEFSFVMLAAYPLFMNRDMTHKLYSWCQHKPILKLLVR